MSENDENILERVAANKLLLLLAKHTSSSLDKFSSWLLAGFGAAFSLILINIESIANFIHLTNIRSGFFLYLLALFFGVIQKWLNAIISPSCAASVESEEIGKNLVETKENADIEFLLNEIKNSTYYPAKWLVSWQYNKVLGGDLSAPGRMLGKLSQIQSYLVLIQAFLAIYSIVIILNGVKV